jgi:hypothetical protein
MIPVDYFSKPQSVPQKQYEALRSYFMDGQTAEAVAKAFGYTYRGFTTIVSDFRKRLKDRPGEEPFFQSRPKGRKHSISVGETRELIIDLRKKYYSVEDIKVVCDSKDLQVSEKTIYNILTEEGFSRLPRRLRQEKVRLEAPAIAAAKSMMLAVGDEEFKSAAAGILTLLPYLEHYGIRKLIAQSGYPETKTLNRVSSILSFIALKASNISRYTADDLWCMDRGSGLFAGLNVLPKAAWFTSYSHRVTSAMNRQFLGELHKLWQKEGLLADTANLDFTTIPYWGEGDHMENNWSGKRGKALSSLLAVLAHDPDSGIIDYADADVKHSNESAVVLEFLDFYKKNTTEKTAPLKYLVFDSKFTNYENLNKLNQGDVKFITIRRRGRNLVERLHAIPSKDWKTIRVEAAGNKKRTLKVLDEKVRLPGYQGEVRQISITGNGKTKPAIIITNDFDLTVQETVRKYARRWLVEKAISEQIEFFHLNKVSSSMVIKVDFDLTMSIVTHNLYRLFARDMERYTHMSDQRIYQEFVKNTAEIRIEGEVIQVQLKKKRALPLVIEKLGQFKDLKYPWLDDKRICFEGATYS